MAAKQLIYIGNCRFQQASEPIWDRTIYGLDTARIPVQGAAPLKKAFEDKAKMGMGMPGYPRMFLERTSDDGNEIFPTVDLIYVGVRDQQRDARAVDSVTLQTVSTTAVPVSGDFAGQTVSMEATYYASRTQYQWAEFQNPADYPRYSIVNRPLVPKLISHRVQAPGGAATVPYDVFVTLYNSLRAESVVSDYVRNPIVPGKVWECESVVDLLLVGS